ncbi:glycosyltransferase family 4 protein [Streptomyces kanamyceticus]|uniref:Glycosyltransferase n=2 Tax=Streptomyces kanamyceticus TaxID=1967 RepID=Q6L735_STRKN|nr:glycosyltransferase family 4 protein [Streptomyces kanamyceticus]QEU90634.1 glycosyltransferase family 1 protein [Streptomyces kanamyceticus]BAD20762.1 glycosyltransferase [Streptomyces kanamyceticus]
MTEPAKGVLALTPFFLYSEYQDHWDPKFDPMGGMHLLVRALVEEMAGRGVPHRVLTMSPPKVPKDIRIGQRIKVHARRLPVLPIPSDLEGYFGLVGAWAKGSLLWVLRNRKRLRREIGAVHAHCDGSGAAAFYPYLMSRILGVPLVVQIHSSRYLSQHPTTLFERVTDPIAKWAERHAVRKAAAVLMLTDRARDEMRRKAQLPAERVHRLAYLASDQFKDADTEARRAELRERYGLDDRPIVLYVGRIAAEKGVEYYIEAAAELTRRGRDCQFVIAGDGPARPDLEKLIGARGLRDRVTITGFMSHEFIPSMISLGELVVLPSRYEELGIVILECMTMRRPLVAHDVNGVNKLIEDGTTGIVVPPFRTPEMADAVERLLDDPELRERMAENAAPLPAAKYSLSAAGDQLAGIYREIGL